MNYFFRAVEDGTPLQAYSGIHLALFVFFVLVAWGIRKNKRLMEEETGRRFSYVLIGILLLDQIILYSWQFLTGFFYAGVSLPLYHCRIAVWLLIFGVALNRPRWLRLGMFWGLAGSLVAMAVPELYKFRFPHYTNFQFFIAHMVMGWLIVHLLYNRKMSFGFSEVREVLILTNLYNLFLFLVNLSMRHAFPEVNYGYLLAFPAFISIHLIPVVHFLAMSALFSLLILLIGRVFETISRNVHATLV